MVEGQLGRLSVVLANTQVRDNTAAQNPGGGIRVLMTKSNLHNGTGNPLLMVDNDSLITHNHSGSNGGGIHCDQTENHTYNDSSIQIGAALISHNSATNGGGIATSRCRHVYVYASAPTESGIPTGGIYMNTASDSGGGIYAENGSLLFVSGSQIRVYYGSAYLLLGTRDHAALVMDNTAAQGGGIAVEHNNTQVQASGTLVAGNTASGDGGAFLVRNHGSLFTQPRHYYGPCSPELVAADTTPMPPCSLVRNNHAGGHGGALRVLNGGYGRFVQTYVENNSAGQQGSVVSVNLASEGSNLQSTAWIVDSLLTGNAGSTIGYVGNNGRLDFTSSTVSGNIATAAAVRVYAPSGVTSRVRFLSSILANNLTDVIATHGGVGTTQAVARCMIGPQTPSASNLTDISHYLNINPRFIDAAGGDYRLAPNSPAIDFCDDSDIFSNKMDLSGVRRGTAWTGPPHGANPALGSFDLGAYEARPFYDIFANGFE